MNDDSMGFYLMGWKQIAAFINPKVHWQTVRHWHNYRLRLPIHKTYPNQQGRIMAIPEIVREWVKNLGVGYTVNSGKYLRKQSNRLK